MKPTPVDVELEVDRRRRAPPPAMALLTDLRGGAVTVVQPVHWLAEVTAVVARRFPVRLAGDTRQHVFDTLYHAVALSRPEARLVTADERYYRAARGAGRLMRLTDLA